MYLKIIKPLFDFIFALIGLLILSPVFAVITLILSFTNNGKPFYFDRRPGLNEKIFLVIKFKTMNDKKDKNGVLLPDMERTTKIGKWIRKSSLDEIPQLLNVLIGQMSLIGPRPLWPSYLEFYSEEQKRRHTIKPGITGWAQINGRNSISWKQKFEYDVYYVDRVSFLFDLKIFFLTIKKVLFPEGINASEEITMEAFNGKN
ncbi:sugar transferase [Flavobacterium sp.]|uniref:sugar transferase n=1 Tax=Flavobacterium sp. TaxID=239 RepID=UPI0038D11A9E